MAAQDVPQLTAAEFDELFRAVSAWGRWGSEDQRGALNYITPDVVRAASGLVRTGETVSLSLPLSTVAGADNPMPAVHTMTMLPGSDPESGPLTFACDYVGVEYHGDAHSHIDALCHVAYQGTLYNGVPASAVTRDGASVQSVDVCLLYTSDAADE